MTISENANERVDCHYDRWFVVQSVDSDHPISKLSPFILEAIRSAVGTAAQWVPSKLSGLSEMAISSLKFLLRSRAA